MSELRIEDVELVFDTIIEFCPSEVFKELEDCDGFCGISCVDCWQHSLKTNYIKGIEGE